LPCALAASIGLFTLNAASIGDDQPKQPASDTSAAATDAAEKIEAKEFVTPPGFVKKKRGKFVLYCKRDSTVGTRIKTESCYDEQQVRDYLLAVKESQETARQIRNNCSNICVCGAPEACNPNIRDVQR
jgi:hypothetical protein